MAKPKPTPESIKTRFWSKVDQSTGPDNCWSWLGFNDRDGYGKFDYLGRSVPASRMAYELTYGTIPAGLLACHNCDNPGCCNPRHIYAGTYTDNNLDTFRRGRRNHKGENCPTSRLTEKQVSAIRSKYRSGKITQEELAQRYGVDHSTISAIVRRKSWTHI